MKKEKCDRDVEVDRKTAATKASYDRIAPVYDLMECFIFTHDLDGRYDSKF